MKRFKLILLALAGVFIALTVASCGERYYDDSDCVGTWYVTFNYDNWGNYDDGGVMCLYYNGFYDYFYSDRDYRYGMVGYSGRWWTEGPNLLYTYGYDTYSYRITTRTYDMLRLRNNYPPGDYEVWYRYY